MARVIRHSASATLIFLSLASQTPARAENLRISVSSDQRVSLTGRGPSLRTAVEDVCYRAGIVLVSWDGMDGPVGGTFLDLPAAEFFARLLRRQSFVLEGVRNGSVMRHTRLTVLGDPAEAAARRARGQGAARPAFRPPSSLVHAAFTPPPSNSDRDAAKDQQDAMAALAAGIAGNPAQLESFLSTDPHLIAQAIQRYEGVEGPLREMQARFPDPRIHRKIDDVISSLASLPALAVAAPRAR